MLPTGLSSLALVATAAALFTTADAHGKMIVPAYRQMSDKFHKDSGALINIGLEEMQIGPIELLSEKKQKDFPPLPTFNLLNGCRGTVYEEGNEVTTLQPGKDFDVKWKIDAPHPGYMKLSILKPSEDSKGVITYKSYKTLLNIEPFAENGGEGGTTAKMPTDVEGCEKPGDCVLQFYFTGTRTLPNRPTRRVLISSCLEAVVVHLPPLQLRRRRVLIAPIPAATSLRLRPIHPLRQTRPLRVTQPPRPPLPIRPLRRTQPPRQTRLPLRIRHPQRTRLLRQTRRHRRMIPLRQLLQPQWHGFKLKTLARSVQVNPLDRKPPEKQARRQEKHDRR